MNVSTLVTIMGLQTIVQYSISGWQGMIQQGGVIGLVLVGFAIVGVAIVVEKSIRLRRGANFNDDFEDVLLAVKRANDDQIEYELPLYPPSQVRMIRTAHKFRDLEKDDIYRELNRVANEYVRALSQRLELLGGLGRLAPLVGLLGTVVGMMQSISQFSTNAPTDPTVLGQGLSQALLTTAAGLIVGIPMIFFHNLFKNRINAYAEEYEAFGHSLVRAIIYPASVEFGFDEDQKPGPSDPSDETLDDSDSTSDSSRTESYNDSAGNQNP